MEPEKPGGVPGRLLELLAGLETGIIGGLVMLAWFLLHSILRNEYWWAVPNLLATTFYGDRALRLGPGRATLSGAALHLATSGVLGAIFALVVSSWRQTYARVALLGLLAGLSWYYLSYGWLWKKLNPLIPAYGTVPPLLAAHLLFGLCLSLYPRWLFSIQRHFTEPPCNSTPNT